MTDFDEIGPYALPDGNVQICFSGGRTSGYLLWQILLANNGVLPDRARVVFTNTGREMPETLAFVAACSTHWGVNIDWVEYRPTPPGFEIVSHNNAAVNGEPFDALIDKKQYLPNALSRFCTIELKIRTAKKFVMSLGWERWVAAVGIRADEPHRLGKAAPRDRWTIWHPLAKAGVTKRDVSAFWASQPFDLMLPNVNEKCWLGNCDGCFLKSESALASLTRHYPERAAWWEAAETRIGKLAESKGEFQSGAVFSMRQNRRQMRLFVEQQKDWIFDDEAFLCQASDGECTS